MASVEQQKTEGKELTALNIIDHLKANGFQINTHWVLFVRLLGLTSDEIVLHEMSSKLDKTTQLDFEECLTIWLHNDEKCSWKEVNAAMEKLMYQHPAKIIFHLYKPSLIDAFKECVTLHIVLARLKAEGITPSNNVTVDNVFELVSSSIDSNPHCLPKLIAILREFPKSCSKVSHQLDLEYAKYYPHPPIEQPKEVLVPLSPKLKDHFVDVITEHGQLIRMIEKMLIKVLNQSPTGIEELRDYLRCTRRCGNELEMSDSLESLVKLAVMKDSSVLNVVHLEKLVREFGIEEGIEEIRKYEEYRKRICKEIKADKLLGRRLCQVNPLKYEKIVFTVRWNVRSTPIEDIEGLLYLAFEDLECEIIVTEVQRGNSIIITCYAPESLINLLISSAQQKMSVLKEKGVMSLTIGYCELLNHKTDYEINKPLHEEIELLKRNKNETEAELLEARAELKKLILEIEEKKTGELLDKSIEFKMEAEGKSYSMEELEPEQKETKVEEDMMKIVTPVGSEGEEGKKEAEG